MAGIIAITKVAALAYLMFNLYTPPCFAAIGAMKREFNNAKWTLAAVGYQCAFAYTIALIVYQLGLLFSGAGFTVATAIAILLLAGLVYLVVRKILTTTTTSPRRFLPDFPSGLTEESAAASGAF